MIWDMLITYQIQIISLLVTSLITGGATFLFYPAILVRYHEAIEHSTKVLREPPPKTPPPPKTNEEDISTETKVLLSLVIPSYNEEDRLTVMLDECYDYLSKGDDCPALITLKEAYQKANNNTKDLPSILVEWIVVNDGSSDRTCQVFESYVQQKQKQEDDKKQQQSLFVWKLVSLPINEGKGAAVQVGMTDAATGYYRLMVDADGATTFDQGLETVSKKIGPNTIVFGSRAAADDNDDSNKAVQRSALRRFLMHSFLWLRSCVVGTPITLRDTQCGFKLFDQSSAQQLFSNLHLRRWAFDIELVYVALSLDFTIEEVTVPWHEVDGSKLNTGFFALVRVSIGMLRDMCCVRACYVLGIWKIHHHHR